MEADAEQWQLLPLRSNHVFFQSRNPFGLSRQAEVKRRDAGKSLPWFRSVPLMCG